MRKYFSLDKDGLSNVIYKVKYYKLFRFNNEPHIKQNVNIQIAFVNTKNTDNDTAMMLKGKKNRFKSWCTSVF